MQSCRQMKGDAVVVQGGKRVIKGKDRGQKDWNNGGKREFYQATRKEDR